MIPGSLNSWQAASPPNNSPPNNLLDSDWEMLWAPYTEGDYLEVLANIRPEDIVVEIGAGDLRLARRIAEIAQQVFAIEIQNTLLERSLATQPAPKNLNVICGDASVVPYPQLITAAVLMMRHCSQFGYYAEKLKTAGCQRLITNARWRMGVEVAELQAERIAYTGYSIGYYACWCGATGFKPGPVEEITPETEAKVNEVIDCPHCQKRNK